jgi:thiamine-phosphate pyrophosphorylase
MVSQDGIPRDVLRIIDANLNRASEGLRVLEDIARLALDDAGISAQLKTLRHGLVQTSAAFQRALVQSRDAAGDVGRDTEVEGEDRTRDLQSVLVANSRRVQESLRVLEELAKTPGVSPELDSAGVMRTRFKVYSLEQDLMVRLMSDKAPKPRGENRT